MGILGHTLIGTTSGPLRVADLVERFTGFSWFGDVPGTFPMTVSMHGETDQMVVVETWFDGGCRDCNHHSNEGLKFYVAPGQEFLLKSGDYWSVEALEPGIRLRVIGRDCGYEEVKSVEVVHLEAKVPVYYVNAPENYAVQGTILPNKVLVRS